MICITIRKFLPGRRSGGCPEVSIHCAAIKATKRISSFFYQGPLGVRQKEKRDTGTLGLEDMSLKAARAGFYTGSRSLGPSR